MKTFEQLEEEVKAHVEKMPRDADLVVVASPTLSMILTGHQTIAGIKIEYSPICVDYMMYLSNKNCLPYISKGAKSCQM
ncbi:MAG: hypothetical protein WBL80_03320 [Erysipelotrichaceae bacterium]